MRKKVRLGFLVALIALLAIAASAWAGPPPPSDSWAHLDIYRTGTPNHELVWDFYVEMGARILEYLPLGGVPRPDGYYSLPVDEDEQDAIHDMVEALHQIMGEDFPIAVSISRPVPIDEDAVRAFDEMEFPDDIYRTGTPDFDLAKRFYDEFDTHSLKYASTHHPLIDGAGVRVDGYYFLMMREENWDVIHQAVDELQQIMGEDFPIAIWVIQLRRLGDTIEPGANAETGLDEPMATASGVFGGHKCTVVKNVLSCSIQTLSFAAISGTEVGMVLSGHWDDVEPMPVGAWVFSPKYYYNPLTNRIGSVEHVGGDYSDSSYMSPYWGGDRIEAGIQHVGTHTPVWGYQDPQLSEYVYYTGQTTGTNLAQIMAYCDWGGLTDQLMARTVSGTWPQEGDSGAPVYQIRTGGPVPDEYSAPEYASLNGVLWAGAGRYFLFSRVSQVIADLDVTPLQGPFG